MNANPPVLPESDDQPEMAASGRKWDPELRVMAAMLRLLDELPEAARPRVVAWLSSRHAQS